MSDRNSIPELTGTGQRNPAPTGADPPKPALSPPAPPSAGRHAAIKSKLPNWIRYKMWVETVRGAWEGEK